MIARVSFLCYFSVLVWSCAADMCSKGCSLTSKNISYTCKNIRTVRGYTFSVPDDVPDECLRTCEHGWYHKNGTFLVDSKEPHVGNLSEPIVEVTPQNLTTYTCLDEPYWKMDCQCSGKANFVASYIAVQSPKNVGVIANDDEARSHNASYHLLWLLTIPVFLMALLLCCCKNKGRVSKGFRRVKSGLCAEKGMTPRSTFTCGEKSV
ncbi:uncharacterized protein LOC128607459 [Ictalurus furcatus]|uniref:uncharacterized protein LOC128607459 n=1 Tax=Ictalurus furcatus TaxID=66913 RepID=UPI002350AB6A|nr:uncharacterized protein LOC128607459 [Ictalurus furcatus]